MFYYPLYVDLFAQGNYRIEREAGEPDPHIVDLNTELGNLDTCLNAALPDVERQYVFYSSLNKHKLIHMFQGSSSKGLGTSCSTFSSPTLVSSLLRTSSVSRR